MSSELDDGDPEYRYARREPHSDYGEKIVITTDPEDGVPVTVFE